MNRHTFLGLLCVLVASVFSLIGQGTGGEGGGGTGTIKPNYLVPTDTNNYPSRTEVANGTNAAIIDATNRAAAFTRGYVPTNNPVFLAAQTNIQAGANITVDLTNPKSPIIASTASGGGGSTAAQMRWSSYAAYGSTDTKTLRFTYLVTNSDLSGIYYTWTTNAANAMQITATSNGTYAITAWFCGAAGSAPFVAISLNNANGTDASSGLNITNRLAVARSDSAGSTPVPFCSWTGPLASNDLIRIHTEGDASGNAGFHGCTFSRIGN